MKQSEPRPFASAHCTQYKSEAKFFIDDHHSSGERLLVVEYEKGGYDGRPVFKSAIPSDWTDQELHDLILWPMESPDAPYPAWEVPARVYGSATLFRWWKGEKAR
jgi:hypothetical protein